jgi:hypothetical protein
MGRYLESAPVGAAERSGFDIVATLDTNIQFQSHPAGLRIALVAATTNHLNTIRADPADLWRHATGPSKGLM